MPANSRITIIGITDHSFTQPYIVVSATIPDDPGYFGERLRAARMALVQTWKHRASRLTPSFSRTDIIGATFLASELFHDAPGKKILIIESDMQDNAETLDPRFQNAATESPRSITANLKGVQIEVVGVEAVSGSIVYWQKLRNLWTEYFQKIGVQLRTYTVERDMQFR